MSGTDIVTVGRALPKLASVEPGNGRYDVQVTWASGARTGLTDTVDLAPMIFTFKVFKPLRDGTVALDTVRLGDYGASIVWPDNEDLDIGADAIEEMAAQTMTNADFSAFLKRNKLTLDAAAAHLGIARRLVAYYAKERDIPRYIALACRQLDTELGEQVELENADEGYLRFASAVSVVQAKGCPPQVFTPGVYVAGHDREGRPIVRTLGPQTSIRIADGGGLIASDLKAEVSKRAIRFAGMSLGSLDPLLGADISSTGPVPIWRHSDK